MDGKAEEEKDRGDPEIKWVGNKPYYTFVLKFALRLFPVTKIKMK